MIVKSHASNSLMVWNRRWNLSLKGCVYIAYQGLDVDREIPCLDIEFGWGWCWCNNSSTQGILRRIWLFPHFARQNAWAIRKVSVLWISVGDVHNMSSFEYFGTLGVHRVRWLGPSLVRFAATHCQAGEILNEKVSQRVLRFFLHDCLRDCWYVCTFRYFIVTIFNLTGHPSRASQKVAIVGRTTGRGIAEDREGTT